MVSSLLANSKLMECLLYILRSRNLLQAIKVSIFQQFLDPGPGNYDPKDQFNTYVLSSRGKGNYGSVFSNLKRSEIYIRSQVGSILFPLFIYLFQILVLDLIEFHLISGIMKRPFDRLNSKEKNNDLCQILVIYLV